MRTRLLILAWLAVATSARAQVTIVTPSSPYDGRAQRTSDAHYGPPRVADLQAITLSDQFQRSHVITEGEISRFSQGAYWTLSAGGSTVLLIPGRDFDAAEFDKAVSLRRVEVRGVVRFLREKQYVTGPDGRSIDLDLVEDPTLPVLPPPAFDRGWPRYSITVFALRDRTYDGPPRPAGLSSGITSQILEDPPSYLGKKVRIKGQFRGRNLFGDLPAGSARSAADWVLKDGETAFWVVGKPPKGDGWKLDPDYKGDTKNWLEVEGKPEVSNGIVYLKASFVMMTKTPKP